jgi:signal transduction histidine kinase
MKANAAIAFLLCGSSLVLVRWRRRVVGSICAGAVALLGVVTLAQHITGWDAGIDQLLFSEAENAVATASPGRMGAHASISFVLAAIALLLVHHERRIARAQTLSFAGSASALSACAGYSFGAVELYGIALWTGIALQTAIALLLLHCGILAARADVRPMALLAGDGLAGVLLRRLTPWLVAIPMILGYGFVLLRRAEIVDRGLGIAMLSIALIVVLLSMLWHTAAVIDVTDGERRRAQDAADAASRLKDQFIAILSHELRTPLNVVLGRLRQLEDRSDEATRRRAATIIARNGKLLARLVEDLLDLSRAASGQFEISREAVDLNGVVAGVIDANMANAAENGVQLTLAVDPTVGRVVLDQQRIQQVVSNIVVNAVKFTGAGGHVRVATRRHGAGVTVTVSDTGIGLDAGFIERLFQPFQQADGSSRRQHGGLGLGLSIAKHLVELHGGTIRAESAGADKGATFVVTLPAAPAGATTRAQVITASSDTIQPAVE